MPGPGEDLLAEAEGSGGHIWVWTDRLRIKHFGIRGLITKGVLKGDEDIWLDQITGIQWREPGAMWLGHIQFTLVGGTTEALKAHDDENAVQFDRSRRDEFERVKVVVEERVRSLRLERKSPAAEIPTSPATSEDDVYEALRKLAQLRDEGILTADEFEQKKAELLTRL